jgi:adenosine deaminase
MNPELKSTWFNRLPKVELHLHLEGAIPLDALWELVQKYGGEVTSRQELAQRFEYKDFPHFIETWMWKNQFLREYDDFTFIAERTARDLASQSIRYAEVFYSPPDFIQNGLQTQQITEAVRKGLERVKDIEIALVADLVRNYGPERAKTTLEQVSEVKQFGVIGIGIGGSEHDFPPQPFKEVYALARQKGFHTSAHAGEAAGPDSVWGAIRHLEVDRIGHGIRAIEDNDLMDYIVEHGIPIEMCPLSNVRTGVVKSYDEHPVRQFFERGVTLNINTDDPMMFGNSLAEEYELLAQKKGFTRSELKQLSLNGIRMSWLPEKKKQAMISAFESDPAWQENL